jgi:AraC family transcriptional regulator of adaptative response/methylated-DNA-[protein]-cysteine methyltransferase
MSYRFRQGTIMTAMNTASNFTPTEQDPRWAAVVARDTSADGHFYYSVATTGVYCLPSCASRTALPKNVRFHATREEAEHAGFRPCKRCRPDQPALAVRHVSLIAEACRLMEKEETPLPLAELARRAGMSPHHFHRVFKSITGVTPRAYAAAQRANKLREHLQQQDSITDAIFEAGYGSNSRFYEHSDSLLGMTPTRYKQGGAKVEIRFALGECSLGSLLVASSGRGICAISLGDDPDALVRELQDRLPHAKLIGGDSDYERVIAQVVGLIDTPGQGFDLPLDIRGTAFQQRVWQALQEIPPGTTLSYTELAARIGRPSASRAVASACAANTLAVAIPCHRVVRTDGSLSGYRWGVERKQALLEKEAHEHAAAVRRTK